MQLTLIPIRSDAHMRLAKIADALVINDQTCDFADLAPGQEQDADAYGCSWLVGDVIRDDAGMLHVSIAVPYGPQDAGASAQPHAISASQDGPIWLSKVAADPDAM